MTSAYRAALVVITLATAIFLYATVPAARTIADGPTSQVELATDKTGFLSDDQAPLRFRGNNVSIVAFVSVVETYCGKAPPGYVYMACTMSLKNGSTIMFMPNPCAYPDSDAYAHLLCHELGHVNGWPGNHPR